MDARDVMSREVVTCVATDKIAAVARLMARTEVGTVIVVDGSGALAGIVTDRDLCLALADGDPSRPVQAAMAPCVIWARPEHTFEQLEALMETHHVHRIPVLDRDRIPIGMVSLSDLAVHACTTGDRHDRVAVARTLAKIRVAHSG
jgi:CBS domain-containing protein